MYLRALLLASAVGCAAPLRPEPGVDARVAAAARSALPKGHVGLVVGTLRDGRARAEGFGRLSAERPEAPDGRTLFEIGSITKAFTGILLARLAGDGKLSIDDPARRHVPEGWTVPSKDGAEITLVHLASHTSGLPRLPSNLGAKSLDDPYANYGEERLRAFLAGHALRRRPGESYEYSNLGAGWLGWMLARADGVSYERLAVERLAEPLGMKDTRIEIDDASTSRLAPPHLAGGAPAKTWDLAALAGAGGLRSTADDLLRFLAANLGDAPSALLRAMELSHEARAKVQEGGPWVGLGWHRTRLEDGRTMIWHSGGTGGYRSFCGFVKESRTGAVVLANSTAEVDALGVAVLELLGR